MLYIAYYSATELQKKKSPRCRISSCVCRFFHLFLHEQQQLPALLRNCVCAVVAADYPILSHQRQKMLLSAVTAAHRSQADHHPVYLYYPLHSHDSLTTQPPLESVKGPFSFGWKLWLHFEDQQGPLSSVLIWELSNENILKLHKSCVSVCVFVSFCQEVWAVFSFAQRTGCCYLALPVSLR